MKPKNKVEEAKAEFEDKKKGGWGVGRGVWFGRLFYTSRPGLSQLLSLSPTAAISRRVGGS